MPHYFFNLKDWQEAAIDSVGSQFTGDAGAYAHAQTMARELMKHREMRTRSWRLEVCDAPRRPCCQVLYASVDDSIAYLPPNLRNKLEGVCRTSVPLNDAVIKMRMTNNRLRSTLARDDGVPYLAT